MKQLVLMMIGFVTVAVAAVAFAMRDELQRELRIIRMDKDPSLVGASLTPQGNERTLGHDRTRARR